jgi:DNA-binding response OmpR family regulator
VDVWVFPDGALLALEVVMTPAAQSLRILVVEDDENARQLLEIVLLHTGKHVLSFATTGEEGLQLLRAGSYHLVVTDIGLPEMSGLEMLLQGEREGVLVAETTVVVCSARSDLRCTELAHPAKYVPKPVDLSEIRAVVRARVGELEPLVA